MEIEIDGFTFNVKITHFEHVKGSYSFNADSDHDYHGYTDIEYAIISVTHDGTTYTQDSPTSDFDEITTEFKEPLYTNILKQLIH